MRAIAKPVLCGGLALAFAVMSAGCGGEDDDAVTADNSGSPTSIAAVTPSGRSAASVASPTRAAQDTPTASAMPADPTSTAVTKEATPTTIVMTPEPTATIGAGAEPTASRALSQLPVDVTLIDGAIEPTRLFARAGEITLAITNNGAAPHRLELSIAGMILVSPGVAPGTSITWLVLIDTPGEYELYSAVNGAREEGMTAVLKVVG